MWILFLRGLFYMYNEIIKIQIVNHLLENIEFVNFNLWIS